MLVAGCNPTSAYAYEVRSMSKNNTTDSNKYHGKPCKHCGGTLRYKKSKICVPCKLQKSRQHHWENRDAELERAKRYHATHPEQSRRQMRRWRKANPEKDRENNSRYWKNNKEKRRASCRRYYAKDIEKSRKRIRQYAANNPDVMAEKNRRRRAMLNNAKHEPYNFKAICRHYGDVCLRCGESDVKLTIDHVVPISKGGHDIASNIQPLCKSCNSAKKDKHIDYRPDAGPLRWLQRKLFG